MFLSVDPLAEDFPNFTPYHYVLNNPINLIDPTGMSAEESDGWIVKDNTTQASYDPKYDGTNTPEGHYYGTAFELEGTVYNADGTTESAGGGTSDCVSCHHNTTFGNGDPNNSPYDRYTVWGYNTTGGDNEKSMRGQNVNAISFSVSDVPLMGAGGACLNSSSTIFQAAKILQHWTSGAVGDVSVDEDPNIKKAVNTMDSLITVRYLPYSYNGGVSAEIDSVPVNASPNSARGKALERSNQTKRATNKIYLNNKSK